MDSRAFTNFLQATSLTITRLKLNIPMFVVLAQAFLQFWIRLLILSTMKLLGQ